MAARKDAPTGVSRMYSTKSAWSTAATAQSIGETKTGQDFPPDLDAVMRANAHRLDQQFPLGPEVPQHGEAESPRATSALRQRITITGGVFAAFVILIILGFIVISAIGGKKERIGMKVGANATTEEATTPKARHIPVQLTCITSTATNRKGPDIPDLYLPCDNVIILVDSVVDLYRDGENAEYRRANYTKGPETIFIAVPGDCDTDCHHEFYAYGKDGFALMNIPLFGDERDKQAITKRIRVARDTIRIFPDCRNMRIIVGLALQPQSHGITEAVADNLRYVLQGIFLLIMQPPLVEGRSCKSGSELLGWSNFGDILKMSAWFDVPLAAPVTAAIIEVSVPDTGELGQLCQNITVQPRDKPICERIRKETRSGSALYFNTSDDARTLLFMAAAADEQQTNKSMWNVAVFHMETLSHEPICPLLDIFAFKVVETKLNEVARRGRMSTARLSQGA